MLPLLAAAWLLTPAVIDSSGALAAVGTNGDFALVSGSGDGVAPTTVVVAVAATNGAITRTAPPPLPDPVIGGEFGSPFEPFTIDARLFSRLPLDPTDIAALVMLSPAATDGGDLGRSHPSIAGGTGFENRWFIDGFEVTDPGVGSFGPWSADYGAAGWSLPFAWVDRLSVTDAAQDPARGGAGGGAIDVVLPAMGDRFSAGASYALRPGLAESPRRNPPGSDLRAGPQAIEDGFVDASGPLVPGHLWFLAGVGFGSTRRKYSAGDALPMATFGEESLRREHLPFLTKVLFSPVHGQELEFLWIGDRGGSDEGLQSPDDLLETSAIEYSAVRFGSEMEGLRWQAFLGSSTDVEATVSRNVVTFERRIRNSADRHEVFDLVGTQSGGIGSYDHSRKGERLRAAVTGGRTMRLAGRHHLRAGGGTESATLRVFPDRSGSPVGSFRDEDGVEHEYTSGLSYQILEADDGTTVVYRVTRGSWGSPILRTGSSTHWGFVEDRWMPLASVTLTGALRVEQSSLHGAGPGATRHAFPAMVAPRLSGEWSARPDGSLVVGAEGGRVVMPVPLRLAERRMSGRREVALVDYSSSNFGDNNQIPDGTVSVNGSTTHVVDGSSAGNPVEDGTGLPWYDEFALAIRWNPKPAWRVDGRYVHRELGQVVDDVVSYEAIDEPQTPPGEARVITNPGSNLDVTCATAACWRDPQRLYDALHLSVHGTIATLDVLASWRISRLFGNYEGVWQTDASEPAGSPAFDFPNGSATATDGNSGPLPLDRTHVLQLAAAFDAKWEVRLGAVAWLRSGRARTDLDAHPVYLTSTKPHEGWGRGGREAGSASLDLRASWRRPFTPLHVTAFVDLLNVFDTQTVERSEPVRADASFGNPIEYTPPRSVRLMIRGEY